MWPTDADCRCFFLGAGCPWPGTSSLSTMRCGKCICHFCLPCEIFLHTLGVWEDCFWIANIWAVILSKGYWQKILRVLYGVWLTKSTPSIAEKNVKNWHQWGRPALPQKGTQSSPGQYSLLAGSGLSPFRSYPFSRSQGRLDWSGKQLHSSMAGCCKSALPIHKQRTAIPFYF